MFGSTSKWAATKITSNVIKIITKGNQQKSDPTVLAPAKVASENPRWRTGSIGTNRSFGRKENLTGAKAFGLGLDLIKANLTIDNHQYSPNIIRKEIKALKMTGVTFKQ
ncbi:Hypothetical predicted protein [Podarcis lilfordi]|uniref:Uncharacterized protein n=1 Tax=Podarcis lilfordi TaxID=74358 RepID=A0AA35PJ30_9SAUR|nr:Hypothetical predicted protein [Podarcis lilfordi]